MKFGYEESGDGFLVSLQYQELKISSVPVSPEGINEGINELLESIRGEPGRRVPQLSDSTGIPAKTIERWVADLKQRGYIEYRGSKRSGGYYAIVKGA